MVDTMNPFKALFQKILTWRSPQQATRPTGQMPMVDPASQPQDSEETFTQDTYRETESLDGGPVQIIRMEQNTIGSGGSLFRMKDNMSFLSGCLHLITQIRPEDKPTGHIRGVAGKCVYCVQEYQALFVKGEISLYDCERLSYVCSDCARMTDAGQLCCPRHATKVSLPDGTQSYLGPPEMEVENRKNSIQQILGPLAGLFGQEQEKKESS